MSDSRNQRDTFLDHLAERLACSQDGPMQHIQLAELVRLCPQLRSLVPDASFERSIKTPYLSYLGLALCGHQQNILDGAICVLGQAEQAYLANLEEADSPFEALFQKPLAALICTNTPDGTNPLPDFVIEQAQKAHFPILTFPLPGAELEKLLFPFLDSATSFKTAIHGSLVVYKGLGLLLLGRSGMGKSDCALDLITNGCQLVADDMVHLERNALDQIIGRSEPLIKHHMDVRGIGIINIRQLFSIQAVLDSHPLDLIIYFEPWDAKPWEHFGEEHYLEVLGIKKPLLHLPSVKGRNWSNLVEVAVRNYMLKSREGYNAEAQLAQRLDEKLSDL